MSYFPSDIPYMTNEEMEEHGINAKRERGMNTDKLWTAISGIEHQLNNLKGELIDIDEETTQSADEAYKKGVEDGRNETWEAAKKVTLFDYEGGLSLEKLDEIFGCATLQQVFRRYSVQQTISKLKAYEEEQKADDEIRVGNERIKAKRIMHEDCVFLYWTCSNCNSLVLEHDNFCSNCGADFRRNEEGEEKDNDGN